MDATSSKFSPVPRRIRSALTLGAAALVALAAFAPGSSLAAGTTIDAAERAQVAKINSFRKAQGLPTLRIDGKLSTAAAWMARDMGAKRYFSHTDSKRRDPFQRLRAFGYPSTNTWRGENIAAGNESVLPTFNQWLNSPPHKANWMNGRFRAIGIARVYVPGSPFGWYWATDFGSRWVSAPA